MNSMKAPFLLVGLCALLLAACGPAAPTAAPTSAPAATQPPASSSKVPQALIDAANAVTASLGV